MESHGWILKILSGVHQGAEILLESGKYTLGKNENCDLVLSDSQLNDQHLELNIYENGDFKITPLDNVSINYAGTVQNSSFNVKPYHKISTHGIDFVIGSPDKQWPDLNKIESAPVEDKIETNPIIEQEVSRDDVDSASQIEQKNIVESDNENFEVPTLSVNEVNSNKNKINTLLNKIKLWFATTFPFHNPLFIASLAITGCLIIFLVTFLWLWNKSADDAFEIDFKRELLIDTKAAIEELGLDNLNVTLMPDQQILIAGYIEDSEKEIALKNKLLQFDIPYKINTFNLTDMQSSARDIINKTKYEKLKVIRDVDNPGSIILTGYIENSKQLLKVKAELREKIPGILGIQEQVEYLGMRIKALRAMLKNKGLNDRVTLLDLPNKILIKGKLQNVSEAFHLKEVVSEFVSLYGNNPKLELDVILPSADMETLLPKLNIKSVSVGRLPFIVLENGQKYMIGAQLENGYILDNIDIKYLTLRLGKKTVKYYIGEN